VASEVQINFQSCDPTDIAAAELARWRRRLGSLTPEQEVLIENLVISTANKISSLSGRVMQSLLRVSPKET
jgi:hypothetical protein